MLTQAQKNEVKRIFDTLDTDRSGVVTKSDFENKVEAVSAIGNYTSGSPKYEALKSAYLQYWDILKKEADVDDDGQVTLDEFTATIDKVANNPTSFEEVIKKSHDQHFDILDLEGSGDVSFEEYKQVQAIWGIDESTARKMFDQLDADGKGGVTREEYKKTADWFFERLK